VLTCRGYGVWDEAPSAGGARGRPDRMSETEKPFTVSDRRHFTPDGRVRDEPEPVGSKEPEESSPPKPPEEGQPTVPRADAPAAPDSSEPRSAEPPPHSSPEGGPSEAAGPIDFTQFVLSLGAQASLLLTGQGLPEDTDPRAALDGVRSYISILEMLSEKTRGNRTDNEDKVLEGLLYELRMAYVETSRAGGS